MRTLSRFLPTTRRLIVFGTVLALTLGTAAAQEGDKMDNDAPRGAAVETIHDRRSVRSYLDQPVSREQLTSLLRAAMAAPSGKNLQPWRFVAIDDRAVLDALAAGLSTAAAPLKQAPAAVVVCGDASKSAIPGTDYWVQDCALAAGNLLLAAHAEGLGALYTGVWPYPDRTRHVAETLGLPETVRPVCIIVVGHPAGKEKPKDKWNAGNVHWNRW